MKNFRSPQVPTISSNILNQSSDFKLPLSHLQDPLGERCLPTEEWTDEKHSMYLKSMEASFVNQLYNSKQVLGWRSPKATLSHSTPTSSNQWNHVGDNRNWKKTKYEREKGKISSSRNEGHDLRADPWIQHLSCSSTATSKDQVLIFSDAEMTDQNFVDDDEEVECSKKNVKKLRPLISDSYMRQY